MNQAVKTILYIEDDLPSRMLVRSLLDHATFKFFEAANGLNGMQMAEKIAPDLILMDINLPDISGVELAAKLKNNPRLQKTVIVALTGEASSESRDISLVAGCDGYINKPIQKKTFEAQLIEFLDGKREQIAAEKRDLLQRRLQERMVDHLTIKIKQLQETNSLLTERTSQLRDYSRKLENVLHVINRLQLCQTTTALKSELSCAIHEQLKFGRCAFLDFDQEAQSLVITQAYGFDDTSSWQELPLPYDPRLFQELFRNRQIVYMPNPQRVPDRSIRGVLEQIGAEQFVFAILGSPSPQAPATPAETTVKEILDSLEPLGLEERETDLQMIQEHLNEYLSSRIFHFGGYLFIDNQGNKQRLTRYDIRLLEMLMRSASMLYQNLQFREQLKRLFIRAEKDAITDHLTNLFNFRYFTQQLRRELDRAERHRSPFVLLMLDIDLFKIYNDSFGHQAGDMVLKKVAELLLANTRSSDFVARYGGEEFVVICPELSKRAGKKIAEKLCRIVEDSPFPREEDLPHKKVTISIGVTAYPVDARSEKELIRTADIALYKAKNGGRNQVQLYQ